MWVLLDERKRNLRENLVIITEGDSTLVCFVEKPGFTYIFVSV